MEQNETIKKKWIKIYPSYLDKALKHSEGRKLSNECAVENPTTKEIFFVCADLLRLDSQMEIKHHPKDWMKRGRVIVGLKEDGKSLSGSVKNKSDLLKFIAKSIGNLRSQTAASEKEEDGEGKKRRKKKK